MNNHDAREALRNDSVAAAAARHEEAEARWKEIVSVGLFEDDEPMKQAFTVGYVLALASLPAPTPAAGEVVAHAMALAYGQGFVDGHRAEGNDPDMGEPFKAFMDSESYQLFMAAPQPPAPGGGMVEQIIAVLKAEQDRLDGEDYLMDTNDCIDTIRENFAALANHSPDAGGVGEHEHARQQELQEIADGAYGDGPRKRGLARDALRPGLRAGEE